MDTDEPLQPGVRTEQLDGILHLGILEKSSGKTIKIRKAIRFSNSFFDFKLLKCPMPPTPLRGPGKGIPGI